MPDNYLHEIEREEWRDARDQDEYSAPTERELMRPTREEAEEERRDRRA